MTDLNKELKKADMALGFCLNGLRCQVKLVQQLLKHREELDRKLMQNNGDSIHISHSKRR